MRHLASAIAPLLLTSLGLTQATWVQRSPLTVPAARSGATMAYDALRGRVLMFGVPAGGTARETWAWNGTDWSLIATSAPLAPGRMTYDPAHDQMVLVNGGRFALFDGTAWGSAATIQGMAVNAPLGGVVYDLSRAVVAAVFDGTIMEWDGMGWAYRQMPGTPGTLVTWGCMAFDASRGWTYWHGPEVTVANILFNTWTWSGAPGSLQQHAPFDTRSGAAMVWHAGLQRIVVFGGYPATGPTSEAWAADGFLWSQLGAVQRPPARFDHAMAYDVARNRIVVFGGHDGTTALSDTWEYTLDGGGGGGGTPGSAPRDVELIDLDGDGDRDVATANEGSDNIGLRTNDGAGALGAESTVALTAADHAPVALVACDLDGDGRRDDLAVACSTSHTLVLLTNPASALVARVSLAVAGPRPSCVAAAALDGNPIDDLVVGREGEPFAGGGGLAVVRNGGVAVDLPIPAPHPTHVVRVALGDLDGDGDADLAALALGAPDEVLLFAGDGAGGFTFAGALLAATSGLANGLCLTDIDRDGRSDLGITQPVLLAPSQTLRIWRRTGAGALAPGQFGPPLDIATPGTFAIDLASGDLEDDSTPGQARVDLAVVSAGSGTVAVHHGFTGTGFASTTSVSAGTNPVAVALGDLNGDGCDDLVVANQASNDVTVVLSTAQALAQTYGTGCGGPIIAATGLPTLGNPAFGVQISNARPFAPVLLLYSPGGADLPLPPGPCHLLVADPILQFLVFSNGAGVVSLSFGVPNSPVLSGGDVFFQGVVFHAPGGAFADTLDFSNGLRAQMGQ